MIFDFGSKKKFEYIYARTFKFHLLLLEGSNHFTNLGGNLNLFYMKKVLLLVFLLPILTFSQICNPNGNLLLYTNYDGGQLTIDIDQDIPNLKIGVVSYESVQVVLTGAYSSNVTGVVVAGYGGTNNHCGFGFTTNSVVNFNGSPVIVYSPPANFPNSNGNANIICGYSCNINSSQGGCNTVDQIEAYMLNQFSGSNLRYHQVQYGCWTSNQLVSSGGNCCLTTVTPQPIDITLNGTDASCFGACDGQITSTVTGGSGSLTYSWTGSTGTTGNLSGLCAGQYILTVSDGQGNQESDTIVLTEPTEINMNVSIINAITCNGEEATVNVTATGGAPPYTGLGYQTLPAGNHSITVEDNSGCSVSETITIDEPDEIVVSSSTIDDSGDCEGSITLSISGGISPYNVQWDANANNQTGESITNLCHDIYCATVTDNNGCEIQICDTINNTVSLLDDEKLQENALTIYPNPSGNQAKLMIDSSIKGLVLIEVYDSQGKLHSSQKTELKGEKISIELKSENKGTYLVRVIGDDFSQTKQWIVGN